MLLTTGLISADAPNVRCCGYGKICEEIENHKTLYLVPHMGLHADGQLGWLSSCCLYATTVDIVS